MGSDSHSKDGRPPDEAPVSTLKDPRATTPMSGDTAEPVSPPPEAVRTEPALAGRVERDAPAEHVVPAAGSATLAYAGDAGLLDAGETQQPVVRKLGEFSIVREIGRGGMGTVFEAVQETLGRKVALKVLRGAAMLDEKAIRRFYREAETIGRLHHPNIIPVYSVGEQNGTHFYAMELVNGITLAEVIRAMRDGVVEGCDPFDPKSYTGLPALTRLTKASGLPTGDMAVEVGGELAHGIRGVAVKVDGAMSGGLPGLESPAMPSTAGTETRRVLSVNRRFVNTAVEMMAQVAEALAHAHRAGIIHRDLKPANLLLSERGKLVLTDFGLARQDGSHTLTQAGDFMGTPLYMSPEQALSGRAPVDHRSDIYSLGVTLYELLTLQAPFEGTTSHAVLREVVTKEPLSFRKLHVRLPRDLEVITLTAMEKDPDRRYQSAQEFADDLRRFLNYQAIRARPPGMLRRGLKLARRYRMAVGMAAAAVLLATALVVGVNGHWRKQQQLKVDGFLEKGSALLSLASDARSDEAAADYFEKAKKYYSAALVIDSDNVSATRGLLDVYLKRCARALNQGQYDVAKGILIPLRELDTQGRHRQQIADYQRRALGTATWELVTQPAGCQIKLAKLDASLRAGRFQDQGMSPLAVRDIEMGNYLVRISHPDHVEVQYPMRVARNEKKRVNVPLLRPNQVPTGMVYVPAGEFLYGDPLFGTAQTLHLDGYFIDRTEVTNAQYERFVKATGVAPPESWGGEKTCPKPLRDSAVWNISWFEAVEYAHWANKRLPTEHEWEKAARGVDGRPYPWGADFERRRCDCRDTPSAGFRVAEWPLGASPYGCLDMSGNVWEWTSSRERPAMTSFIMRGGAGYNTRDEILTYRRQGAPPGGSGFGGLNLTGLRCAKSLVPTEPIQPLDLLEFRDDLAEAAEFYWSAERFDMVQQCCTKLLRQNPRSIAGHYWLSGYLRREEKFAEALASLKIVYMQDPTYRYAARDIPLLIKKLTDDGQNVDQAFLELPKLLVSAARALKGKDYTQAEKNLLSVLEIDPQNAAAHEMLTQVCTATARPGEAALHAEHRIAAFRVAVAEDPGSPELLNEFAWFLAQNGLNYAEGIKLIEQALEVEPDNAAYIDTFAELLHRSNRSAEALACIRQAIELDPRESHYQAQRKKFESALAATGSGSEPPKTKGR